MKSPYARVYFSVWADDRFVGIIDDDHHFATWVRLLLRAEAAWPQSVAIPRSVNAASLEALVEAGIIELHPLDTYRIHGLDAERERRSLQGRTAIAARWGVSNTDSITGSDTDALHAPRPRTSSSSPSLENEGDEVSGGWAYLYPEVVALTGKHAALGKFAETLCELAAQAGPEPVIAAMRAVAAAMAPVKPDIRALAFGVNDALRRPPAGRDIASAVRSAADEREAARKAAERAEAKRDRQKRALDLVKEFDDAQS